MDRNSKFENLLSHCGYFEVFHAINGINYKYIILILITNLKSMSTKNSEGLKKYP